MKLLKGDAQRALYSHNVLMTAAPKDREIYWSHARLVQGFLTQIAEELPELPPVEKPAAKKKRGKK